MSVDRWPIDARLRHWHPVILADRLAHGPLHVECCGIPLVLFQQQGREMAALYDRCAHRRMPLSHGAVGPEGVTCPYHGCVFSADGAGYCPTTRTHRLRVPVFECAVLNGVVWVRSPVLPQARGRLTIADINPDLANDDHTFAGVIGQAIAAPLQLVVDNMTELEHTGTVHRNLAFGMDDFDTVETRCEPDETGVSIHYRGRQRPLPRYLSALSGLRPGDLYVQEARVTFTPPCASYRIRWTAGEGGAPRRFGLRFVIYYTEVDAVHTALFAFVYWKAAGTPLGALPWLFRSVVRRLVAAELGRDREIIEKMPRDEAEPAWFQLNRFDRPLMATRRLMTRWYAPGIGGGAGRPGRATVVPRTPARSTRPQAVQG